MARLSEIERVQVLLDLIQDGEVDSRAAYAGVDTIDAATGLKYVRAFWDRRLHKQTLIAVRTEAVAREAADAERVIVEPEADADVGTEESIES